MFSIMQSIQLSESISHIEDLGIQDFLKQIENISKFVATEKLDGANLRFGIDNDGKFYTTRAGKGGVDLKYSTKDYEDRSSSNGFKAAHAALKDNVKIINQVLVPGEAIEIEVIFGRQPNAVVYGVDGTNFIAFLQAVPGTDSTVKPDQNKIKELSKLFKSVSTSVNTKMIDTSDGESLQHISTSTKWKFIGAVEIASKDLEKIDVAPQIKKLKAFLNAKNEAAKEVDLQLTNFDVATINLTSVDKSKRDTIKREREVVNRIILNDFKLPIKEKLLSTFVRKIRPKLQASKVEPNENIGVEGVVLRNPENGDLIKIVDKDVFTAINKFNFEIRNQLSGIIKTDDPLADIETRGGLFGEVKIRIASLFGISALAKAATAKKVFAKFKGSSEIETAKAFANSLGEISISTYKTKIIAIFKNLLVDIEDKLKMFKAENASYKLELKNGKTIGYSPEIVRRTLISFAELKVEVKNIIHKVEASSNIVQLIMAIYEAPIKSLHATEISESLVLETKHQDIKLLKKLSHDDICNSFMATYLAALLLLRTGDTKASALLKDSSNFKKYSTNHGILNFWGTAALYPESVEPYLGPGVFKQLKKTSGRIIESRVKKMLAPIASSNNMIQDWFQHDESIKLMMVRLGLNSTDINTIRMGIKHWDELGLSDKNVTVAKTFYYLMQYVNNSPLISLLRKLANRILTTATNQLAPENETMPKDTVKEGLLSTINRLTEEGEGGADAGTISSSAIATVPTRLFPERKIIKRKRPKTLILKRPSITEEGEAAAPAETTPANPVKFIPLAKDAGVDGKEIRIFRGKVITKAQRNYKKRGLFARPVDLPKEDTHE